MFSTPVNHILSELARDYSVAELRQMLEEKKKEARMLMEDSSSSVESGFGSQGDREADVDTEFQSGIGSKLKRKVNLWHQQTLQIESLKNKRMKSCVVTEVNGNEAPKRNDLGKPSKKK